MISYSGTKCPPPPATPPPPRPLRVRTVDRPDNNLSITCMVLTNSGIEALETCEETIKCARYQFIPMCVW